MGATAATKKNKPQQISFTSNRRFGIELELNAFDGMNRPPKGQTNPTGIEDIAALVCKASPEAGCEIRAYEHTNKNACWVAKPDSSCGLEVVSPPRKGWKGLKDCLHVVSTLAADERIKSDQRCSVHVHLEVADLTEAELAAVVHWWVKCEAVILDAMPPSRKRNRYCQSIGMNNQFQHDGVYTDAEMIAKVGDVKYYSFNTSTYTRGTRKTIEFRTIEGDGCRDAYLVKQWVRFILHFVEMAKITGRPKNYHEPKNEDEAKKITPWTGLCWLDPEDVFTFLGFNNTEGEIPELRKPTEYTLSKGMQQTRDWFLARLWKFQSPHKNGGMRFHARQEVEAIIKRDVELRGSFDPNEYLSPTDQQQRTERIFGDDSRF